MQGLKTKSCPTLYVDEFADVFRSWNWYQQGVLPVAGGWADQSPIWLEIMALIDEVRMQCRQTNT